MDFQYTEKVQDLINQVRHFINTEIRPVEGLYHEQLEKKSVGNAAGNGRAERESPGQGAVEPVSTQ